MSKIAPLALATSISISTAQAEMMILESFDETAGTRWSFFTDGVMGGVSKGNARLLSEQGRGFANLAGDVSTDNNGGFVQIRRPLTSALPATAKGLMLEVRGNGEEYFVFLRTRDTRRPWFYYSASFPTSQDWSEVTLPLSAFKPSNRNLPDTIDPARVTSIGLVAYGRDHAADLSVASISIY